MRLLRPQLVRRELAVHDRISINEAPIRVEGRGRVTPAQPGQNLYTGVFGDNMSRTRSSTSQQSERRKGRDGNISSLGRKAHHCLDLLR